MSIYLKEKKTSQGGSYSVLLTVVTTLFVVSLLFGAFLYGQNSGSTPAKALPTLTLSSSVISSSRISSDSSTNALNSSTSTSTSSSISEKTSGVYTDSNQPTLQITYGADWTMTTAITKDIKPLPSKTITFTHTNGSVLVYTLSGSQGGSGTTFTCLSSDQIVDLGNGWYRVRKDDGARLYIRDPNTTNPENGGESGIAPCPAAKHAASTNGFAYVDGSDAKYDINISLSLVGEDKSLADTIVLSTLY